MLQRHPREGLTYVHEATGKKYPLLTLESYGGNTTTDIVVIWDEEHDTMLEWFYGATCLLDDPDELEKICTDYVNAHS